MLEQSKQQLITLLQNNDFTLDQISRMAAIAEGKDGMLNLEVGDKLVARQLLKKGRNRWPHVGSVVTVVGVRPTSIDIEYEDGGNVCWTRPIDDPDTMGVYWEKL